MNVKKKPCETKRVLVVDDDPDLCALIRSLSKRSLAPLELKFASTVQEAVTWLTHGVAFDLVLADFLLADSANGYTLRGFCDKYLPEGKFAMMSSMPLCLPEIDCDFFLQKPFSRGEWQQFVQARLA